MNRLSCIFVAAASALLMLPTTAAAGDKSSPVFLAVLSSEKPRLVQLGTLDIHGADLLDTEEGWIELPAGECLAILRRDDWLPRPSRTQVVLTDGQVLTGRLIEGDENSIRLDHPWMRELNIPLERVARVDFHSGVKIPPGDSDRVILANGDVLSGFVERLGSPTVIETDGPESQRIEVQLEYVAAVDLASDVTEPSWPQVWLVDGVRMSVPQAAIDASGRLDIAPHPYMVGTYERMPQADEVVAVVLDGDRFTPLATIPARTDATSPVRRRASPPRRANPVAPIGLTDLHLSGPARYTFALPKRAQEFRAVLARSRNSKAWPAPTLTISVQGKVLWSGTAQEDQLLNLPIDGMSGSLVIDIACGAYGPVHCDAILVDPIMIQRSE